MRLIMITGGPSAAASSVQARSEMSRRQGGGRSQFHQARDGLALDTWWHRRRLCSGDGCVTAMMLRTEDAAAAAAAAAPRCHPGWGT